MHFDLELQLSSRAWNFYLDMLISDLTVTVIYKDLGFGKHFRDFVSLGDIYKTFGVSPLDYLPRTVFKEKGDQINTRILR